MTGGNDTRRSRKSQGSEMDDPERSVITNSHEVSGVGNNSCRSDNSSTNINNVPHDALNLKPRIKRRSGRAILGKNVGGMFADAKKLNADLYENIAQPDYDVSIFYHQTGIARTIATSDIFANITMTMIILNTIWIGYDSDHNHENSLQDADLQFKVGEYSFFAFFLFEWSVRFAAFSRKLYCLYDHWFKFDSALVLQMVLDTIIIPIVAGSTTDASSLSFLKILKLARLARMVRIVRAVPEMLTMMKGIAAASRSVSTTLGLLIACTYIFGIVFADRHKQNPHLYEHFGSIPKSMWTLFLAGMFMDNLTMILTKLFKHSSAFMLALFVLYVLVSALTFLNMLIGVLCEVVSSVAESEKEKRVIQFVKEQLVHVLGEIDSDGSGYIDKNEFKAFLDIPEAQVALQELGVDDKHLLLLGEVMFSDEAAQNLNGTLVGEAGVSCSDVLEKICHMRATNNASVTDVVDLQKYIRHAIQDQKMDTEKQLSSVSTHLAELKCSMQQQQQQFQKVKSEQNELKEEVMSIRKDLQGLTYTQNLKLAELDQKLDLICTRLLAKAPNSPPRPSPPSPPNSPPG